MVNMLASSEYIVGPRPGRVKPKTIKLEFAASPPKTDWFRIRIMCPSGAICLPADCCFSELGL
jgi:hypothetical protein